MTDGEFTESDAENDGLVKREAGQQLNSVLARESGELYTKFRKYCDNIGRDPSVVLGDMILRAIQNDSYAQEVASTVVDVERLNSGEVKKEDLEMVTDIINQFSDQEEQGRDPIDKMLEERLSAVGQGPLGAVDENRRNSGAAKDKKIRELERQIEELRRQREEPNETHTTDVGETREEPRREGGNSIDDLFDNDSEEEGGGKESEEESGGTDDLFPDGEETEEGEAEEEEESVFVNLGGEPDEADPEEDNDPMTANPDEPFSTDNAVSDGGKNE